MSLPDDWPEEAKEEMARLETENEELQQEVGRSVAKIMALQARGEEITDGEVKKRFEGICTAIEDWTTAVEFDFLQEGRDFGRLFLDWLDRHEGGATTPPAAAEATLRLWGLLEKAEDGADDVGKLRWLGQLDTCIKVVLSRAVWYRLDVDIFARRSPPGTPDVAADGMDWISEAVEGGVNGKVSEGRFHELAWPTSLALIDCRVKKRRRRERV
jgi:hypothetical protein